MMVSPILLLMLALFGVSFAVTEHPLSPSAPRAAALKEATEGKVKNAPAPTPTAVYTGNDPDILNLVSMLQRNGFTDNDELREALRILRPEKFAKGDAKEPRAKRQAEVAAKKEQLSQGDLQPDSPSNLPVASSESSSDEQTAELLPAPYASNQKEELKKEGKKKGLEKIDLTEEKKQPPLSQSNRLKRSWAPHIRTPNPLGGVLNTPKTPYIPQ